MSLLVFFSFRFFVRINVKQIIQGRTRVFRAEKFKVLFKTLGFISLKFFNFFFIHHACCEQIENYKKCVSSLKFRFFQIKKYL